MKTVKRAGSSHLRKQQKTTKRSSGVRTKRIHKSVHTKRTMKGGGLVSWFTSKVGTVASRFRATFPVESLKDLGFTYLDKSDLTLNSQVNAEEIPSFISKDTALKWLKTWNNGDLLTFYNMGGIAYLYMLSGNPILVVYKTKDKSYEHIPINIGKSENTSNNTNAYSRQLNNYGLATNSTLNNTYIREAVINALPKHISICVILPNKTLYEYIATDKKLNTATTSNGPQNKTIAAKIGTIKDYINACNQKSVLDEVSDEAIKNTITSTQIAQHYKHRMFSIAKSCGNTVPNSYKIAIKYQRRLGFSDIMKRVIPTNLTENTMNTLPEEFKRPILYFISNKDKELKHRNLAQKFNAAHPPISRTRRGSMSNLQEKPKTNNQSGPITTPSILIRIAQERSMRPILNTLGAPKTVILTTTFNNTYITYSYITSESGTAPDKRAFGDLPAGKAICNRDEVMSIINDKKRIKITDNHGQKIKLIQDLFNSSKLAVLYHDDATKENGMIHKKKDGPIENTKNHRSPSFALIFLYAYKQAPTVAPTNSLPQPESQIIMANNNNISPFLTGQTNNNKQAQKALIKLDDKIRIKVLNRPYETTEAVNTNGEIYPIRMPQIGITNIVNSLNPGTGIYLYGTSAQNITANSKKMINNLNIYCKTNESSGDIKKYKITLHPETGSQIITGIPNAPLDATIFNMLPAEITHIIGRDMQLLSSGKLVTGNKPQVGIMGGGRIH